MEKASYKDIRKSLNFVTLQMPKVSMASEFDVLDGIPDKKRGMGAIICLLDRKLYLRENLVALPLEYL